MASYLTPGIYIEEVSTGARPIEGVGTTTTALIGEAPSPTAVHDQPVLVTNWTQFCDAFVKDARRSTPLSNAVAGFFLNGGTQLYVVNTGPDGVVNALAQLATHDEIAIIAAPGWTDAATHDALLSHCEALTTCFAILDVPAEIGELAALTRVGGPASDGQPEALRPRESERGYGAAYFPHITMRDALDPAQLVTMPPSGHLAGLYARSDTERGVFKAPANMALRGALGLTRRLNDAEQGLLNPAGVNVIRFFAGRGVLVWGARTLAPTASEWRYIPVRRLFIMIENSIRRGTQWVVFEPNDERLWKSIRRDVSAFLTLLWREGALQGTSPEEAFFVKCDAETNPQQVIDAGQVVIEVGIAPVKPAEFVVFRIGHISAEAI